MQEKIIESKKCNGCNVSFNITDKDLEFYNKVSPVFEGKKYDISSPTLCPECRQQRRLSFRNERNLYRRKCDATGKDIITSYSPDKNIKVLSKREWDSDNYNPTDYGLDYSFDKTFFSQFQSLLKNVPKSSLYQDGDMLNSDFTNFTGWLKDCYMVSDSGKSEFCFYGNLFIYSKNCFDCSSVINCELCYETINSENCYMLTFSKFCLDCRNSSYLNSCVGCTNCFGCINLNNKSYCFFNEQLSKEEYLKKIFKIKYNLDLKNKINLFFNEHIYKNLRIINSVNSSGDILNNCESVKDCYECFGMEKCKFCENCGNNINNSYDISAFGEDMDLCYELSASGGVLGKQSVYNCLFGVYCYYGGSNLVYCIGAHGNSKYCFGCTGLKGNSYCILNKQYTKEEYNKLVPKIIEKMKIDGEWGEFFPSSLSPFGYNETVAEEYFPLEKEEAIKSNFNWSDYKTPFPNVEKIISADKLPENITDIPDDILNWAIECEVTKKPFRIIKQELDFYRKHKLPIPKRHPDQRHLDRMKLRNPRKLFDRKCDKCHKDIKTTYSLDREEIIYCEECYNKEVY